MKGLRRAGPSVDEFVETAAHFAVFGAVGGVVIGGLIALALRKREPRQ